MMPWISKFPLLYALFSSISVLSYTLNARAPSSPDVQLVDVTSEHQTATPCFPALGFTMPSSTPSSLNGWWCNATSEYAFLGFSYEITACKSKISCIKFDLNLTAHFCFARSKLISTQDRVRRHSQEFQRQIRPSLRILR